MSPAPAEAASAPVTLTDPPLLQACTEFLLPFIPSSQPHAAASPVIIGINGLQGAGKTTLVSALSHILSHPPHSLSVLVLSIDDFYLPRADQAALAASFPGNKLLRYRGEPGTHDIGLLKQVLSSVLEGKETRVPRYDKSAFGGLGDRLPPEQWDIVNTGCQKTQVILLEGWCVGFRPLDPHRLEQRWRSESRTLKHHELGDLILINDKLQHYNAVTAFLDAFIHLDAEHLDWVYDWRLQQEHALIAEKGSGMSDSQVEKFVDGYYPAYELYYEGVRNGVFVHDSSKPSERQLRIVVGQDRKMKRSVVV